MTYEEFRDWVANLPQADYRHEDFGQGLLPKAFRPSYAKGICIKALDSTNAEMRSFLLCILPKDHPGPCIGGTSFGDVLYMKDRLSYRSGLRAALTSKPYEETS